MYGRTAWYFHLGLVHTLETCIVLACFAGKGLTYRATCVAWQPMCGITLRTRGGRRMWRIGVPRLSPWRSRRSNNPALASIIRTRYGRHAPLCYYTLHTQISFYKQASFIIVSASEKFQFVNGCVQDSNLLQKLNCALHIKVSPRVHKHLVVSTTT